MSHGHDHAAGHDAHGHDAPAPHHGPVELPPEPTTRSITPAPEDFRNLPGPTALAWPVLWMALAVFLAGSLLCGGWPERHEEPAEPGHGAESHR